MYDELWPGPKNESTEKKEGIAVLEVKIPQQEAKTLRQLILLCQSFSLGHDMPTEGYPGEPEDLHYFLDKFIRIVENRRKREEKDDS